MGGFIVKLPAPDCRKKDHFDVFYRSLANQVNRTLGGRHRHDYQRNKNRTITSFFTAVAHFAHYSIAGCLDIVTVPVAAVKLE